MLPFPRDPTAAAVPRAPRLPLAAAAVGVLAGVAGILATSHEPKSLAKAAGTVVILLGAVLAGRTRQVLLFCWAASLTYYRSYFLSGFEADASYGPFWIPSDVFFVGLLAVWAYEVGFRRRRSVAVGAPMVLAFVPFAVACALSAVTAYRADWTAYEMARVLRVIAILVYVRYNVGRGEWWTCLAAIGASVVLQTAIAVTFMVTGSELGFSTLFGAANATSDFAGLGEGAMSYSYRRAQGTFGHPNTFSLYLLLVLPTFTALALTWRGRRAVACGAVALAGLVALATTLSRTGWAVTLAQLAALAALLPALGLVSVRRVLGVAAVGGFAAIAAAAPFTERIEQRLTGDFMESVDFRTRHAAIALEIWQRHPFTGIGLNNYSDQLRQYGVEEVESMLELEPEARLRLNLRFTAWVHNVYLLILAETGLVGLTTFLGFLAAVMATGVHAARRTRGAWRAVCVGLVVGMCGGHLSGLQESALWIDPATYTFALIAGLLGNAVPLAAAAGAAVADRARGPRLVLGEVAA